MHGVPSEGNHHFRSYRPFFDTGPIKLGVYIGRRDHHEKPRPDTARCGELFFGCSVGEMSGTSSLHLGQPRDQLSAWARPGCNKESILLANE